MDKSLLMFTTDGLGLNFLELKMMHMMCLVTSALKYSLKWN